MSLDAQSASIKTRSLPARRRRKEIISRKIIPRESVVALREGRLGLMRSRTAAVVCKTGTPVGAGPSKRVLSLQEEEEKK
jgi:hypothetical protein